MTRRLLLSSALGILLSFTGAKAQGSAIYLPIQPPPAAYLQGVGHVYQTLNNCGPASILASMANYHLNPGSQEDLRRILRPAGTGYMNATVIDPFVKQFGLTAVRYRQGNINNLKAFIASGIPIIVLQYLNGPGSVPHFRVVRGYDDRQQVVFMSDSMYGPNVYVKYKDFQSLWKVYNNEFIPILPAQMKSLLPNLVGGVAYKEKIL